MINPKTGEMVGLYGLKHNFLSNKSRDFEVSVIEVDKWKEKNAEE